MKPTLTAAVKRIITRSKVIRYIIRRNLKFICCCIVCVMTFSESRTASDPSGVHDACSAPWIMTLLLFAVTSLWTAPPTSCTGLSFEEFSLSFFPVVVLINTGFEFSLALPSEPAFTCTPSTLVSSKCSSCVSSGRCILFKFVFDKFECVGVPCEQSLLRSSSISQEEEGTSADILDNSYWACSNFSATSIKPLLWHPLRLSAYVNVSGNEPVRFHPSVSVFPLDMEAL